MGDTDQLRSDAERVRESVGTLLANVEAGAIPDEKSLRDLEVYLKTLAVHIIVLRKGVQSKEP